MKAIGVLIGLMGFSLAQNWQLSETGLCIDRPVSCPTRTQKYGVCCRLNNTAREFSNYCQACSAGCGEWKYKLSTTDVCK